jgi:hypothetical protein
MWPPEMAEVVVCRHLCLQQVKDRKDSNKEEEEVLVEVKARRRRERDD